MKVTVSAPGKIFLMGEHAVVYGNPALLTCIDKRVTVSVKDSVKTEIFPHSGKFIKDLVNLVKNYLKMDSLPPFQMSIDSQLKSGYHLGSSAAVSASVIACMLYFLKKIWNPDVVNKLAYDSEKILHGNPSGADNSAVVYGGFVWYRKEFEFLKNIWQLPVNVPEKLNHFYLLDTGHPKESTREMVELVAINYKRDRKRMAELFEENEIQTKNMVLAFKNNDVSLLVDSIKIGEETLEEMGVVSNKVLPVIKEIKTKDGSAKILGGGGSAGGVGYVLCFHKDTDKIQKIAQKYGYPLEHIKLGEEGLKLEKNEQN